jgi:predicted HicB family RNase H-like nuclease
MQQHNIGTIDYMSKKSKNTLSDALNSAASSVTNYKNNKNSYANVKSREGKRMIAGYFTPDVHRNLKMIAAQNDISIQDIVYEAINNYLKTKGYPAILQNEDKSE